MMVVIFIASFVFFEYLNGTWYKTENQVTIKVDAVVVGAGPSGIAAALEIGRSGKTVILVEQTNWLGGQMTAAAVPNMDEGYLLKTDAGIYGEFIKDIKKTYGTKPINTCYWNPIGRCFDPSVGRTVLENMIAREPNIRIMYSTTLIKVRKVNNSISSVLTQSYISKNNAINIQTSIIIDASETGYILPLAGAPYRIGNEVASTTSISSVPISCTQAITYPVIVRKYFNGVPADLKMTEGNPPGGMKNYAVAAKVFANSVTKTGNDWFVNGHPQFPYDWSFSTGYRAIPDSNSQAVDYSATGINTSSTSSTPHYTDKISKTIINMANDVGVTTAFLYNPTVQQKTICQAKLRSLQYVYYMQIDLGEKDWSIANDEGYEQSFTSADECPGLAGFESFEKYLPVIPYIRESRRLIGNYTLNGADIAPNAKGFPSSLAVGDYSTDMHGCMALNDLESGLDTKADISSQRRLFEVPFESFVTNKVGGLIVAEKNISSSRVAEAALREQPIAMQTGLAAGAIAVVALNQHMPPSMVDYHLVQNLILQAGGKTFK